MIRKRSIFILLLSLTLSVGGSNSLAGKCLSTEETLKAITAPVPAQFYQENSHFTGITTDNNVDFYVRMRDAKPGQYTVLNLELSILKTLNDEIVQNKPFANAIANAYKKNVLKFLEDVEANPELSSLLVEKYSDYKSVRLAFKKGNPRLEGLLEKFSEDAAERYHHDIEALGLQDLYKREGGIARQPLTWHLAGIGDSVSQARVAAIYSEKFNQGLAKRLHVSTYHEIREELQKSIAKMHKIAEDLSENQQILASGLLEPSKTPGKNILSLKAMGLLKKSETPEIFQAKALELLNLKISKSEAEAMLEWYHTADTQFSPGITQLQRVSVHSIEAPFGVIAVDYRKLSDRKIQTALEGIAEATDHDPDKAIEAIDRHFEKDHARLVAQHARIAAIAKKLGKSHYFYSGDELYIVPDHFLTPEEKKIFIAEVAKDPEANHIRTGFSHLKDVAERSQVLGAGDKLESATREQLQGKIPLDLLLKINMGMSISKDVRGAYRMQPIVSEIGLTEVQKQAVEKVMIELAPKYISNMSLMPVQFVH